MMSVSPWYKACAAFVVVIGVLLAIQASGRSRTAITITPDGDYSQEGPREQIDPDGDNRQERPHEQIHKWEVTSLERSDFESLPSRLPRSFEGIYYGESPELNRYSDIIPTPETIVTLNRDTGDKTDNYINANFVNEKDYIATQGPLPKTITDFWLMVWEQEVSVIVMVTGIKEGGRVKCERYWPDDVGSKFQAITNDGIHITMVSTDEHIGDRSVPYVRSELLLEHGGKTRTVHHFWYNTWPDMGVPVDTNGEVEWQGATNMLSTIHTEGRKGPWVVHCSAGIGRTGTFIGIDMGQRKLEKDGKVDVLEVIKTMRDGRGGMVQTYSQAEFMQSALFGFAEKHNRCTHGEC